MNKYCSVIFINFKFLFYWPQILAYLVSHFQTILMFLFYFTFLEIKTFIHFANTLYNLNSVKHYTAKVWLTHRNKSHFTASLNHRSFTRAPDKAYQYKPPCAESDASRTGVCDNHRELLELHPDCELCANLAQPPPSEFGLSYVREPFWLHFIFFIFSRTLSYKFLLNLVWTYFPFQTLRWPKWTERHTQEIVIQSTY